MFTIYLCDKLKLLKITFIDFDLAMLRTIEALGLIYNIVNK